MQETERQGNRDQRGRQRQRDTHTGRQQQQHGDHQRAALQGPTQQRVWESPRPSPSPTQPGSRSWLPGGSNSPDYSLGEGTALTPLGPRVPKASSSPSTGWWFDACGLSNLNGVYYPARHHARKLNGIRWHYFQGPSYSLRATRMMLRPAAV